MRLAMVFNMKRIINGMAYTRYRFCSAWYRENNGVITMYSYDTPVIEIMRFFPEYDDYRITVNDYKGVTTQKQITRFLRDFCGYTYANLWRYFRPRVRLSGGNKATFYYNYNTGHYMCQVYSGTELLCIIEY